MSFGQLGAGFGSLGIATSGSSFTPFAGADIDIDFISGNTIGVVGPPSSFLTTTRASVGYVNDGAGNWTSVAANLPRISNLGLLAEEARTNLFLNSQVPVTQTITVVSTSTYSVSVIGVGSLVLSGALTGTVTQGSPVIGAASTTSLTVTTSGITGAFVNAQVELGASVTSPIVTTGASASRAADVMRLTTPPVFGAAYSMFAKGTPQTPTTFVNVQGLIEINDGTASNRISLRRNSATAVPLISFAGGTSGTITATGVPVWAQNVSAKLAGAAAAADQAFDYNGGTVATNTLAVLPASLATVHIGSIGAGTSGYFCGFVERIALWPTTRILNATLQTITS